MKELELTNLIKVLRGDNNVVYEIGTTDDRIYGLLKTKISEKISFVHMIKIWKDAVGSDISLLGYFVNDNIYFPRTGYPAIYVPKLDETYDGITIVNEASVRNDMKAILDNYSKKLIAECHFTEYKGIQNDADSLNFERKRIKSDTRISAIKYGIESVRNEINDSVVNFYGAVNSENDLLLFLEDKEKFCETIVNKYVNSRYAESLESILSRFIWSRNVKLEYLDQLSNDKDFASLNEIYKVLNDNDYKTCNVTVMSYKNNDSEQFEFKIKTDAIKRIVYDGYIPHWSLTPEDSKVWSNANVVFNGVSKNITLENIMQLRHGKKIIWKRSGYNE